MDLKKIIEDKLHNTVTMEGERALLFTHSQSGLGSILQILWDSTKDKDDKTLLLIYLNHKPFFSKSLESNQDTKNIHIVVDVFLETLSQKTEAVNMEDKLSNLYTQIISTNSMWIEGTFTTNEREELEASYKSVLHKKLYPTIKHHPTQLRSWTGNNIMKLIWMLQRYENHYDSLSLSLLLEPLTKYLNVRL